MYTMYTRVIGLCVCFALALFGCGDDEGAVGPENAPCTPGAQSMPSLDRSKDPCPQNDVMSMCMPFPQMVAVTECCTAIGPNCPAMGRWRRTCSCIPTTPPVTGMGGAGGSSGAMMPKCGDGVVQAGAPFNEKCDPGDGQSKAAAIPATCSSLGMGSGMVACTNTCQYDMMMCSGTNGGGGAGGS
jgi:hypothetical protein